MGNYFELFNDSEGKHQITAISTNAPVPAGGRAILTIFIRNISSYDMQDIVLKSNDPDLTFTPKIIPFLAINAMYEVLVIWMPPSDRTKPLNAVMSADFNIIKRA
jgi:hypothetical protein